VISTTATVDSTVNIFPITINVAMTTNYSFNYLNGTLTIISLNANNVSDLLISSGTLSPLFTSGPYNYTASVNNEITNVNFTLTFDPNATAKIDGSTAPNGSQSAWIP
jgi:hypothetical protein